MITPNPLPNYIDYSDLCPDNNNGWRTDSLRLRWIPNSLAHSLAFINHLKQRRAVGGTSRIVQAPNHLWYLAEGCGEFDFIDLIPSLNLDLRIYILYELCNQLYPYHKSSLVHGEIKRKSISIYGNGTVSLHSFEIDSQHTIDEDIQDLCLLIMKIITTPCPDKNPKQQSALATSSLRILLNEASVGNLPASLAVEWLSQSIGLLLSSTPDLLQRRLAHALSNRRHSVEPNTVIHRLDALLKGRRYDSKKSKAKEFTETVPVPPVASKKSPVLNFKSNNSKPTSQTKPKPLPSPLKVKPSGPKLKKNSSAVIQQKKRGPNKEHPTVNKERISDPNAPLTNADQQSNTTHLVSIPASQIVGPKQEAPKTFQFILGGIGCVALILCGIYLLESTNTEDVSSVVPQNSQAEVALKKPDSVSNMSVEKAQILIPTAPERPPVGPENQQTVSVEPTANNPPPLISQKKKSSKSSKRKESKAKTPALPMIIPPALGVPVEKTEPDNIELSDEIRLNITADDVSEYADESSADFNEIASRGELTSQDKSNLEAVSLGDPNYTHNYSLLLINAQTQENERQITSAIDALLMKPENQSNPYVLLAAAHNSLHRGQYENALEQLQRARNYITLPIPHDFESHWRELYATTQFGRYLNGESMMNIAMLQETLKDSINYFERNQDDSRAKRIQKLLKSIEG